MLPKKIAFVDIETTGMSLRYDRIIEIAIMRVEDNKLVETYSSLINADCTLTPEIISLTGIDSKELEKAPTFGQMKHDIIDLLDDCLFTAHNARFDYGFLKNEFRREEANFTVKHLCTAKLSRFLYPRLNGTT